MVLILFICALSFLTATFHWFLKSAALAIGVNSSLFKKTYELICIDCGAVFCLAAAAVGGVNLKTILKLDG